MSLDEKSSIRHSRPTAARDLLHHVVPLLYYDGEVMEAAITALGMVNPAVFRCVETLYTTSLLWMCTVHTMSSLGMYCTYYVIVGDVLYILCHRWGCVLTYYVIVGDVYCTYYVIVGNMTVHIMS